MAFKNIFIPQQCDSGAEFGALFEGRVAKQQRQRRQIGQQSTRLLLLLLLRRRS